MANLKDIRDRIKSVKSIQKVTKAMKMVAAAKMRKAQERMEQEQIEKLRKAKFKEDQAYAVVEVVEDALRRKTEEDHGDGGSVGTFINHISILEAHTKATKYDFCKLVPHNTRRAAKWVQMRLLKCNKILALQLSTT